MTLRTTLLRLMFLAGLVVGCVALAAPSVAEAQAVVVESFSGPQSAPLRAALLANFAEDGRFEVKGLGEVNAAARDLGVARNDPRVAANLSVVAFIRGTVTRARRRW